MPRISPILPTSTLSTVHRRALPTLLAGALCAALCAGLSGVAPAQEAPPPADTGTGGGQQPGEAAQGGNRHHGPPPEALAACSASQAGAACSFTSPRGPVSGKCWAPEGKPLACRPARDHQRQEPPSGPAGQK